MKKILCRIFSHKFERTSDCYRVCVRCGYEETIWQRRFPDIGEAEYSWSASPGQMLKEMIAKDLQEVAQRLKRNK